MTNEETIKILKTELEVRSNGYYDHLQSGGKGDCEEEASLNALQLAIKSLEKQIPQKPYKVGIRDYECPKCHKVLHVVGYPCRCGQMIDWRGEE